MKFKNIKYTAFVMLLGMGMTSCGDFLDKPVEEPVGGISLAHI